MGLDVPVNHVAAVQEGQAAGDVQGHLLAAVPPGQPVLVVGRQRFPQVTSLQQPRQNSRPVSCADLEHSVIVSAAEVQNTCLSDRGKSPPLVVLTHTFPDWGLTEKDTRHVTSQSSLTEQHMEVARF